MRYIMIILLYLSSLLLNCFAECEIYALTRDIAKDAEKLIKAIHPAAKISNKNENIIVEWNVMEYKVHYRTRMGEWTQELCSEIGPVDNGYWIEMQFSLRKYRGTLARNPNPNFSLKEAFCEPYFYVSCNLVDLCTVHGAAHITANISFNASTDTSIVQKIYDCIIEIAKPKIQTWNEENANKLTITLLETATEEITDDLGAKDIQRLERAVEKIVAIEKRDKPEASRWPAVRKANATMWRYILWKMNAVIEPNFDSNNIPEINVVAPAPYPPGVSPELIKEPDIRKKYEQAIAENAKKRKHYEVQRKLAKIKKEIEEKATKFLIETYGESSNFLDGSEKSAVISIKEALNAKILKHLKD